MSGTAILFHAAARVEITLAAEFYDENVSGLGSELIEEVHHTLEAISTFPAMGRAYLASTRRSVVPRFPFSLVYRLHPDRVVIIALAHHRRKPGYWRDRVGTDVDSTG